MSKRLNLWLAICTILTKRTTSNFMRKARILITRTSLPTRKRTTTSSNTESQTHKISNTLRTSLTLKTCKNSGKFSKTGLVKRVSSKLIMWLRTILNKSPTKKVPSKTALRIHRLTCSTAGFLETNWASSLRNSFKGTSNCYTRFQ